MSFKIQLSPVERIASRFMGQVHASLANAAVAAKRNRGLTQRELAAQLKVDKSQISKILKGTGNPTIRTIGELAAVMGYRPEIVLHEINQPLPKGQNYALATPKGVPNKGFTPELIASSPAKWASHPQIAVEGA